MENSAEEKKFYTRQELDEFETLILEKLEGARDEYRRYQEVLRNNEATAADAEFGSESRDKEEAELLMARTNKFIVGLENAMIRIKNGTYGVCKETGKLIPKERLRVVPHTTTSIEGKRGQSKVPVYVEQARERVQRTDKEAYDSYL